MWVKGGRFWGLRDGFRLGLGLVEGGLKVGGSGWVHGFWVGFEMV